MPLTLYQVDAFTDRLFAGNPAAVCPLEQWLDDATLQAIAEENNLSETAFFVPADNGYQLRWFTPEAEVDLCGHATLAAAHVLYQHLGYDAAQLAFFTRSGTLTVSRTGNGLTMDFPGTMPQPVVAPQTLVAGLGAVPAEVLLAFDYVAVFKCEAEVQALTPDFMALRQLDKRGVLATAPAEQGGFVSRCFFPKLQVDEDPVTGSAHCELAPYWAKRLGQSVLTGRQLSKRGGQVHCEVIGDRVRLTGQAVDYLQATLQLSVS